MGISPQRAHEAEQMAKNREVVERYIEETVADGKAPSKNGALKEIKKQNEYIKEGEEEQTGNRKGVDPRIIRKAAYERDAIINAAI